MVDDDYVKLKLVRNFDDGKYRYVIDNGVDTHVHFSKRKRTIGIRWPDKTIGRYPLVYVARFEHFRDEDGTPSYVYSSIPSIKINIHGLEKVLENLEEVEVLRSDLTIPRLFMM